MPTDASTEPEPGSVEGRPPSDGNPVSAPAPTTPAPGQESVPPSTSSVGSDESDEGFEDATSGKPEARTDKTKADPKYSGLVSAITAAFTKSSTADATVKPNMGELIEHEGRTQIRMGGVPNSTWTDLVRTTRKFHPNQMRGYHSAKNYKYRIEPLEPKFKRTDKLEAFQTHLLNLLERNGSEQCGYLWDPRDPTVMINVIEHPHQVSTSFDHVKTMAQRFTSLFDQLDEENDSNFREVLLQSLEPSFKARIDSMKTRGERAIVTWIRIVREVRIMTDEQESTIARKIQSCKIQDFTGMNFKLAKATLEPLCDSLSDVNAYDAKDLLPFLRTLATCLPVASPYFGQWWIKIDTKYVTRLDDEYKNAKRILRMSPNDIEEHHLVPLGLGRDTILEGIEEYYEEMLFDLRWPAASNPKDSKAPSQTYGYTAVAGKPSRKKKKQEAHAATLVNNISKGNTKGCFTCGSTSHFQRDCPDKDKSKGKPKGTGGDNGQYSWKRIGPKEGEPKSKEKNGKTYYWCTKCNGGTGRWTLSHLTEAHTSVQSPASTNYTIPELADPSAWCTHMGPNTQAIKEFAWESLFPMFVGVLLCLSLVHISLILQTTVSLAVSTADYINWFRSTWLWQDLFHLTSIAPCLWTFALTVTMFPPKAFTRDTYPTPRKERRSHDQAFRRYNRRHSKGASILDYGYHKSYPMRLRILNLFWRRPPNLNQQSYMARIRTVWYNLCHVRNPFYRNPRYDPMGPRTRTTHGPRPTHGTRPTHGPSPTHGTRPSMTRPSCYSCRPPSHMSSPRSNVGRKGETTKSKWHHSNPLNKTTMVRPNGKTYYWCDHCNHSSGRWTLSHNTFTHDKEFRPNSPFRPPPYNVQGRPPPMRTHQATSHQTNCFYCVLPTQQELNNATTFVDDDSSCGIETVYSQDSLPPLNTEMLDPVDDPNNIEWWEDNLDGPPPPLNGHMDLQHADPPIVEHPTDEHDDDTSSSGSSMPSLESRPTSQAPSSDSSSGYSSDSSSDPPRRPKPKTPQRPPTVISIDTNMDPNATRTEDVNMASIDTRTVLQAPEKLRNFMGKDSSFNVIWDSGASHSISPNLGDFTGKLNPTGVIKRLSGLAHGLNIKGVGTVKWSFTDVHGNLRSLHIPAYYVPSSPVRLLSTSSLLQKYQGEHIIISDISATLSGIQGSKTRTRVEAHNHPTNNIPTSTGYDDSRVQDAVVYLNQTVTEVDTRNRNLTEAEKELIRWHQKLGHMAFKKVKFLMRTGILSWSQHKRKLHELASKIVGTCKCAACQFGKQTAKPSPTHRASSVTDRPGILKDGKLHPGQHVSVDHFVCSTKGVLPTSRGGTDPSAMFCGGCIFVDSASALVHVEHQTNLSTHSTLEAKTKFEAMCRDMGVIPQEYLMDQGSCFTSAEFAKHLSLYRQISNFTAAGAHQRNAIAERSIRTIMSIARTMMLHSAIHWPEMSDATLWPFAVDYAVYLFNRMPDPSTGLSPLDVFSKTRWPQRRFQEMHVWGAPAYLLDKKIADGMKLPKWSPRSERVMFVGVSSHHTGVTPIVLNPRTRAFTKPYHLVVDDWFATVGATETDPADFNTPEWKEMFGEATYHYSEDDEATWLPTEDGEGYSKELDRREQIGNLMDQNPPVHIKQEYIPLPDQSGVPPTGPAPLPPARETFQQSNLQAEPQRENSQVTTAVPLVQPLPPAPSAPPVQPETPVQPRVVFTEPSPPVTPPDIPIHHPASPPVIPQPPTVQLPVPPTPVSPPRAAQPPAPTPTRRSRRAIKEPKRFAAGSYEGTRFIEANTAVSHEPQNSDIFDVTDGFQRGDYMDSYHPCVFKASNSDPNTMNYDKAMKDPVTRHLWIEAAEKEIRSLERHGTWEEVPISSAKAKIIPVHWIFKLKTLPDGTLDKMKGRVVVRGDLMDEYQYDTHSPVCAWSSIRIVLILSLLWGWHTCTCDYSNAFVHSYMPLDNPLWIHLPRGYKSDRGPNMCLKLKRSLYGTTFAPKLWSETLFKALKVYGLNPSEQDPCLFLKPGVMVCCFVDDLAMSFSDIKEKEVFLKSMLDQGFELTMDGTINSFLGIKFEETDKGCYNMTQPGLIDKIIETTDMQECNPTYTPATPGAALGKDPDGQPMTEPWSYRSCIGMLLYLSTNTRPDLSFAVSQVARFSHNPKSSHANAVKTIVRYLKGTRTQGTRMKPDGTLGLIAMSDADFCGLYRTDPMDDLNSAKSRMGYIISLGGCPLIWKSQLISCITLATAESEYYALSRCLRTLIPIIRILKAITQVLQVPAPARATIQATAFEDNSAALQLATTHRLTSRTRYFHTQSHHFWEYLKQHPKDLKLKPVESALMDADYATKAMPREGFEANRKRVQGW